MKRPHLHLPRAPDAGRRLSEMLAAIANDPDRDYIAVADIRDAMGDRAFGAMMFVFAAPNALPVNMPGVSTVLGLPLLFLSLQLMLGVMVPWLPRFLVQRTIRRQSFARVMNHAVPWIRRAERLLRPRLEFLAVGPIERLIGLLCVVLCIVLILPIPFGNTGPAIAICVLALALLERDGLAVLAGLGIGVASVVVVWGVILAIAKGVSLFVRHWLGW
jgi:hypothetical protein